VFCYQTDFQNTKHCSTFAPTTNTFFKEKHFPNIFSKNFLDNFPQEYFENMWLYFQVQRLSLLFIKKKWRPPLHPLCTSLLSTLQRREGVETQPLRDWLGGRCPFSSERVAAASHTSKIYKNTNQNKKTN
jgi:hypothetical protein